MQTCAKCNKVYADNLKTCPNCSGRRGVIGLLAIVVIAGATWVFWPSSPQPPGDTVPATQVTSVQLAQAFQANEVAAQKAYGGGQVLDVTGIVTGIVLDFLDRPTLHLEGANEFLPVQAQFDKSFGNQISGLSKAQQITVRCASLTSVISAPMLSDCSLVNTPSPASPSVSGVDQGQLISQPNQPAESQDVSNLIQKEEELNDLCRDGSGDDPKTQTFCDERDKRVSLLKAMGWCYGLPDQIEADKKWQKCNE